MTSSKPALIESMDSPRYWTPLVSSVSMLPLGSMVTTDLASSEDHPLSLSVFWMPFLSVISLREPLRMSSTMCGSRGSILMKILLWRFGERDMMGPAAWRTVSR